MGFNTVAVLFNDQTDMIEKDGALGARIAKAMRNVGHKREGLSTWFGAGQCISQAHADYDQIVVVGCNTGRPLSECNDLGFMALAELKEALERHGYRVTKRRKIVA